MIYYQGYTVSFQEVPDEVSLVISIADCPHKCPGCHSPQLQKPKGNDLEDDIDQIIDEYGDVITCVCFMGEGRDLDTLKALIHYVHDLGYKTCLYTGSAITSELIFPDILDYAKFGPYIQECGGLDSPTTNQCMLYFQWRKMEWHKGVLYTFRLPKITDITYKFQCKKT